MPTSAAAEAWLRIAVVIIRTFIVVLLLMPTGWSAVSMWDARNLVTSSCEDSVVFGRSIRLLICVFALEVFVHRAVEGTAKGLADALV